MNDMTGMSAFARVDVPVTAAGANSVEIGRVMDIAGSSSQITLDAQILAQLQSHPDPSIAAAGQVGSQVKLKVDERWLIANVRSMRLAEADGDLILAQMDFLGEGDEDAHAAQPFGLPHRHVAGRDDGQRIARHGAKACRRDLHRAGRSAARRRSSW